jgi:salicylate hydroxylase
MLTSTGFSSNTNIPKYRVASEKDKLTIEGMNG